jgi:hypothetical protein
MHAKTTHATVFKTPHQCNHDHLNASLLIAFVCDINYLAHFAMARILHVRLLPQPHGGEAQLASVPHTVYVYKTFKPVRIFAPSYKLHVSYTTPLTPAGHVNSKDAINRRRFLFFF